MRRAQTAEEAVRAIFHFAALWEADGGDRCFLLCLLKQVYLNPRFNAPARLPGMLNILLEELRSTAESNLLTAVIDRFDRGRQVKVPDHVRDAVEKCRRGYLY
jgi:hypothetical protein